ncbi:hypothetical protein SCP_0206380 [Sparassis crispa]|uniref:Actin cytoskeleton-regulatory complex protein SLA1 n=1 Tax=Sparassis crispa TaxID=139825 RepID=A0A401GBA6_9APHY|nr:hypothetical protein SCP_0206380 [Sparassis crispa]GBE79439.1 hypothetical protein SCP_0206380 [Sparassis crispa]
MAEQETYLAVLKASYDYDPQPDAEEELTVKENQLLLLLERTDDDWWKVKIKPESQEEDGPSGLVPAAYVEPAEHISVVKALYDYEATQSTELNVKEDEILLVFDKDDDWLLVQSQANEGKVGYVPGNYVEETTGEEQPTTAVIPSIPHIVVPPSPPRPVSVYIDPADRVAAAPKAQADDIQTWSVSEVDKKGKKKKGTLGVGNGAVFFASESDKTPVQKWQTSAIQSVKLEKSKHVHIEIGGDESVNLHFHAGSKDVGEAIIAKLESSRLLSAPPRPSVSAEEEPEPERLRSAAQKAVHFDAAAPEIIPPREPSEDGEEEDALHENAAELSAENSDMAVALYDFTADGVDELSVQEGESLIVIERDSDEWWKCRNASGAEGVVPASYVETVAGSRAVALARAEPEEDAVAIARAAREEEERAEARRRNEDAREKAERERAERESRKLEAERRAKAAAAAAEADRKRRERERETQKEKEGERERAAAEEEARQRKQRESTSGIPPSPRKKSNGDSSSGRTSSDRRGPPPENTRVWHDRTGQFRVEAAFLGFANGKLRLHKVNGVVIEVPSEKMSSEDLRYIEKLNSKKSSPPRRSADDDDEPLEQRRRSLVPDAARSSTFKTATSAPKKGPTVDWFEFFLNAGCDVDDCTRYATSFERDKIDEAILPDITESTMRSLGLREGDIIRVKKAIEQMQPKNSSSNDALQEQLRRDEELARQLQVEDNGSSNGRSRSQPPNLFAAPNGALKTSSMRRGRPQPSKSLPPSSVDLKSITTASGQILRSDSPIVTTPETTTTSALLPVQPPPRSSSAMPSVSGFDDDAWTNRPSSTKPLAPTPPVVAPRAPSAPPASAPALPTSVTPAFRMQVAPTPPVQPAVLPVSAPATSAQPQLTGSLAKTTENDVFDQLARLSQIRNQTPAIASSVSGPALTSTASLAPPISYQSGLGMGSSPIPTGQHLQAQRTGLLSLPQPPPANAPRGPFAPVPANQSLLQPLIPTTTGFNSFVPTRPQSAQSPFQTSPQPMSFLSAQPTGFANAGQPLMSQITGFPNPSPMSQPTAMPSGNFGSMAGGFSQNPSFQTNSGFGQMQSNPTGFNPGFGQLPFSNGVSSPPPAPPASSVASTSPANVFAQMKSGTFATNETSVPQSADKYDALRPNPLLTAQPTGWGYSGMNGYQNAYGYQG